MKAYPINQNQTNFKALYKPNNYKFTEAQQRMIKDIETKLGDRVLEDDYSITPYGGFAVALSKVEGYKHNPYNTGDLMFEKTELCAICDEKNPLDLKKLEKAENDIYLSKKQGCLNVAKSLFIALVASAGILTAAIFARNNVHNLNLPKDAVNKVDILKNNLPKDSLNLTKHLF